MEKHYFVPCPHCGEYIELKFAQIKWPSKDDVPDNAERAEMAFYVCQACGGVITDQDTGKMLPPVSSLVHSGSSQAGTSVCRSMTRSALVFDLEYAEQVTAEHKITERSKGKVVQRWALKASHAANHYLDCEVKNAT